MKGKDWKKNQFSLIKRRRTLSLIIYKHYQFILELTFEVIVFIVILQIRHLRPREFKFHSK